MVDFLIYCMSSKVRTFWEALKIWKNLPHGFDKSADLLSKRQNHEEDFFKICVLLRKSNFITIYFFNMGLFYYHMSGRFQNIGDEFCLMLKSVLDLLDN